MKGKLTLAFGLLGMVAASQAILVDTRFDLDETTSGFTLNTTATAAEYGNAGYTGGGAGFGGTLGAGSVFFDFSATKLNMGVNLGNNLNDIIVIYLDTKASGFVDSQMSDYADGGRRAISDLARDSNEVFDATFRPDYAIAVGNFGNVMFELASGGNNSLIFKQFESNSSAYSTNNPGIAREISMNRSDLALTGPLPSFNWSAFYVSGGGFMSNESMPAWASLNGAANPGFGTAGNDRDVSGYNRFAAVPEPGTMAALGLGAVALIRRRKAAKKS
jgi:hypothetical protein